MRPRQTLQCSISFLLTTLAFGSIGCQPEEQPRAEHEELSRFFEDHVLIGDVVHTAIENANPPSNLGTALVGVLSISEPELTFDLATRGSREQTLTLSNTGYGNLRIEDIAVRQLDPRFRITKTAPEGVLDAFTQGKHVYLAPGYDLSVDIELGRGEFASTSTWLEIKSSDPVEVIKQVPLVDKDERLDCDGFIITASLLDTPETRFDSPAQLEAQTSISLMTHGVTERFDRIEWSITHKPVDSTTRFVPNSQTAEPKIFIDLEGDYTFLARIYRDGVQLCADAEFDVSASAP